MLAEGGYSASQDAAEDDAMGAPALEQGAREALASMARAQGEDGDSPHTTTAKEDHHGIVPFSGDTELKMLLAQRKKLSECQQKTVKLLRASEQQEVMLEEQRDVPTTLRDSTGLGIMAKVNVSAAAEDDVRQDRASTARESARSSPRSTTAQPQAGPSTRSSVVQSQAPLSSGAARGHGDHHQARPRSRNDPSPLPGAPAKKARQ